MVSMAERVGEMTGYAGDLSPRDAWQRLQADKTAVLVDVRSRPEWSFVGVPDLTSIGKRPIRDRWRTDGRCVAGSTPTLCRLPIVLRS